ncbi:DUF1592 domain-containing protein [Stieleria sp. JC731]|uniref:DUF1592 domain-containing protein n=1 Tax=Pirellulaceae TaxID=2691357 RepID=UPI001E43B81C|nr:DUF1592 domain-containing protein [Stieleria sp. JC731]MCC9599222.1 DUF1592 domain-containing protein [Stieleria sp. JC731]
MQRIQVRQAIILLFATLAVFSHGQAVFADQPSDNTASEDKPGENKPGSDQVADTAGDDELLQKVAAEQLAAWKSEGLPLMQTYCVDCHNADFKEAGLDLTPFETLQNTSPAEVQRVLEMVRFGAMPPEDYDTPEIEERKQLVRALEDAAFASTCDLRPKAGKVTVRRLNRSEYNNSVRDLFGTNLEPANKFPSDEVGAGFDNNADVLSLSPMLIEKYFQAAESVAADVIGDPDEFASLDKDWAPDQIPVYGEFEVGSFNGRFVDKTSFAWVDIDVPFEGEYRVEVRGGVSSEKSDPIRVAIVDGEGLVLAVDELKYFGGSGSSDSMRQNVHLPKGKQRLAFIPVYDDRELKINETRFDQVGQMDDSVVKQVLAELATPVAPNRRIDFGEHPFMYRSLDINGPQRHPKEAFPPKHFELVREMPPRDRGRYRDVKKTAMKNLREIMPLVFRGPVTDQEIEPYAELVEQATRERESFYVGMRRALTALLVSPRFLFRAELPSEDAKPNEFGDYELTQHQLAARLSYFLWSSTPDKTLLKLADEGKLTGDEVGNQVQRLLRDDHANALASNFAAQWLGLRNLDGHEADEERFPMFDDELKSAMSRETELLFMHVMRENLPVSEFLTADYSFVNSPLAKLYGLESNGAQFEKVSLAGTPRRGLLSHASVLTLTSMPTRTSPVLRGKWILENILGIKAPDPPAGVPELEESGSAAANASLREQLELHRQSAGCASCHRVMDQLGFGLDDFDAIGRYRTEDGGHSIDASGAMPDGRSFNGGAELSKMLGDTEIEALARTITERMLTFAIGRELTPDDRCTIDEVVQTTRENGFRLADIVSAIVDSRQFRFQSPSR